MTPGRSTSDRLHRLVEDTNPAPHPDGVVAAAYHPAYHATADVVFHAVIQLTRYGVAVSAMLAV